MPVKVFIDGQLQDKITNKNPLVVALEDGPHEVAIALDEAGTLLRCATELESGELVGRHMGCPEPTCSTRTENTVLKLGIIHVSGAEANGKW